MPTTTPSHAHRRTDWAEHAFTELERAGFRKGGARRVVVEHLAQQACALTATDIELALRKGERGVGRASVYRVLDQLTELGLVTRIDLGQAMARYERVSPGGEHHHHLVCDHCGTILPFEDPALERSIARLSDRMPFAVAEHEVVLHGSCGDCADRAK